MRKRGGGVPLSDRPDGAINADSDQSRKEALFERDRCRLANKILVVLDALGALGARRHKALSEEAGMDDPHLENLCGQVSKS